MQSDDNASSSATFDAHANAQSGVGSKLGTSMRHSGRGNSGDTIRSPSITSPRSPSKFLGVIVPRLSAPRSASSKDSAQLGRERGFNAINTESGPTASRSLDLDSQSTTDAARDRSTAPFARDPVSLAESISFAVNSALAGIPRPTDHVNNEEEILELISPEVAREYHTEVTAASDGPAESDDELLELAYPRSEYLTSYTAVNETGRLEKTEAQSYAQNGVAFTGSIVDALSNAFTANEDSSSSPASSGASQARPTRQGLFLEALSGSDSDTPDPPTLPSHSIPEREPRASLRVAQLPRSHAAHTVELKIATDDLDEYLDTKYATHAYRKEWSTPLMQSYELPPVSSKAPEPIVFRRAQYTSVTEHFLQRAEEWFGPEALQQLDQAALDGPAKNLKKSGTASTKPPTPNSAPKSSTTAVKILKRKRAPSVTESSAQKGPRVLEELNGVPSRATQENARNSFQTGEPSLSASDIDLLRRFVVEKTIPTDEEVNALNHLVSSLKMEGEHNVFEGKTTANGHFHILVPKKLVSIASRSAVA